MITDKAQEDLMLEVSKDNIWKHTPVKLPGWNDNIAGVEEDIWDGGGIYPGFNATVAEKISIVSDNANDTVGGSGAKLVKLFGLDANWNQQSEILAMQGLTPVESANQYIRVPIMKVRLAGSNGANIGTITYNQKVTMANVFGKILPGNNRTLNMVYSIPADADGYLMAYLVHPGKLVAAFADIKIKTRVFGGPFITQEPWGTYSQSDPKEIVPPLKLYLPQKSDIKISAIASVACGVGGWMDILEIERGT